MRSDENKVIWYLVKFFSEERYADQFMDGTLYLNRLSFFKRIEEESNDGRPDANEAVAMWWQPDDISIKLKVSEIGDIEITQKDLAGPVSMSYDYHNYLHVFCMYAIHTSGFECVDGKIEYLEDEAEILKRQIEIDSRCLNFGKFAVITPATQFLDHLKESLRNADFVCKAKLVEYYDEELFHGEIEVKDIPFKKQKKFNYQNEFRICINPKTMDDEPICIKIGNIGHITAKIETDKINDLFQINSIKIPV